MWLVNFALRNPYSVYVGMLLVTVLGVVGYQRTPTDILPQINVPVVVVFASYRGMPAPDMERSVTTVLERALTRCDHLEHIESRSLLGIGIIKVFFRPQVNADVAASQVIALVNGEMQNMPPGMLPPSILKFDASAIPVGNLLITSAARDDKELLDIADHGLREELATVEGLASAPVFGGVFRQVQIYVHPRTLESLKLSPMDVARIVNTQSLVIPTGEIRIGEQTYYVSSNSMVETPDAFAKIPLYAEGRKVVYLGDAANVLDATRWRTNTVHVDGRRAVYMPLLRQAGASAVRVVDNVKAFLPELHKRGVLPPDVQVEVGFDQSQYVREALANLRLEGMLGALLASLLVLLFLGSMRSAGIVALSIPLSVLAGFVGLYFLGHTLNIMTLGGLALILGRVVDDSIVDVENTLRHLGLGKAPADAVRASAAEISLPVLMATLTTVIVFFPLAFMAGAGRYLFLPLAVSATLAMAASYVVARTVSPLFNSRFLRPHGERERFPQRLGTLAVGCAIAGLPIWALDRWKPELLSQEIPQLLRTWLPRDLATGIGWLFQVVEVLGMVGALFIVAALLFHAAPYFQRGFELLAAGYERLVRRSLQFRWAVLAVVLASVAPGAWCLSHIGHELFPEVDTSEFTLHVRLRGGPRVEATEERILDIQRMLTDGYVEREKLKDRLTAEERDRIVRAGWTIEGDFKQKAMPPIIPSEDLELTLTNLGVSSRWSAIYTPNNGPHAAFVRVQLRSGFAGRSTPTLAYVEKLRAALAQRYPSDDFFFETGGMIRRILNAGALAPIEVQVHGRDTIGRRQVARILDRRISRIESVKDTYLPQAMNLPQLKIDVDRTAAARLQLTQNDIVRNVIAALMSSAQLAPNFWIDPTSGNPYVIGVQYPEYAVEDLHTLENIPITSEKQRGRAVLLREVARIDRTDGPIEVFHYDVDRVSQLLVNVGDNDLAGIAAEIDRIVTQLPLEYALASIPEDKLVAFAVKVFPRDKGDPAANPDLQELLETHFKYEDPATTAELEEQYGVDIQRLDLREQPGFRERLEIYLKKGRDSVRREIQQAWGIDAEPLRLPPGVRVTVRGEISSMRESFAEMGFNLGMAVLLVYLVMAAQFSSWLDPLIVIVAAPLGFVGTAVMLWLTGTSLNIQSLMGVLMMVGISVSNSVLLVDFANRQRAEGLGSFDAAVRAARTRLRPILITTLATILGLLPMAVHLHPGDEMNLPLARAVIGGLAGSTVLTLFVVPVLYVMLKRS